MSRLIRWGKFNLVGAMGMAVQLSTLALFNCYSPGHYLAATASAIEITLLHNFVWHTHYTWRDRRDESPRLRQLFRFHLSNGLVSMLGNIALMWVLVREARLPVVMSNVIAIVCCSIVNFTLGHSWAFAAMRKTKSHVESRKTRTLSIPLVSLALLFSLPACEIGRAQTPTAPPTSDAIPVNAPTPQPVSKSTYQYKSNGSYFSRIGIICGVGGSTSATASKPTAGCGAGLTILPLPLFFEVGVMGPQANRSFLTGYISLDGSVPLARPSSKYLPMAILGYSRLFETGHALDYGLVLASPRFSKQKDPTNSLRIELRDYYTFANPSQHNIMLRIGWMSMASD